MRVRSFSAKSLYPSQKQKQPSFEDCFFSSMFPFLPCYNFMQCKGVRYASPNCDRCYGARNSLLAPDYTVDFCFAKIAAATNLVSLRETGSRLKMIEPLSPATGCFRLFSLFSSWRASARLRLKKKKFLENFSVSGAGSFYGADFCHNDKEAAVNT